MRRLLPLRDTLWAGSSRLIWDVADHEAVVGFATVSRLMPLVTHLVKHLSAEKGGDPSPVYWELWCRDFGQGLISIIDESECAYASGYSSTRALRTWREHMLRLVELGFILARREGLREYAHVLLLDPLAVCAQLHADKRVPDEWWTAFVRRCSDIKAKVPRPIDIAGAAKAAEEEG